MDEAHHYTLHIASYTPAVRLPGGKHDGAFRTKLQIAQAAGIAFKAILADRFYGDNYALGRTLLERWWTAELTLLG